MENETNSETDTLLEVLRTTKPVGKNGVSKSILPPWPAEINDLLSTEATKVPKIEEVTIQELFNINTVSIQRRVDKARKKANLKYLKDNASYCPETGRMFAAVELSDGSRWLIDGNTRVANYYDELRYAVKTGDCPRFDIPATVTLLIHYVDNLDDGIQLYYTYDNQNAVERAGHKMTGAIESLPTNFKNKALLKGNYRQGLKVIADTIPGISIKKIPSVEYGIIKEYLPELQYIDKNATFSDKPMGGDDIAIVAGMLRKNRASKREQQNIIDFENCVASQDGEGSIIDEEGRKNGIAHLHNEYFATKPNRRFPHRSSNRKQLLGLHLFYYDAWCEGKMLKNACGLSDDRLMQKANKFLES